MSKQNNPELKYHNFEPRNLLASYMICISYNISYIYIVTHKLVLNINDSLNDILSQKLEVQYEVYYVTGPFYCDHSREAIISLKMH